MFRGHPPPSSGVSLTAKVVLKVAERENVEPADLPPLADVINPDALDVLFDTINNPNVTDAHLSFNYLGHTVHVYGDCSVEIE